MNSKPPSQLQSVEQAWEFGQAPPPELETDSLLLNKSAQRSQWQRTTAMTLLALLTTLSLAVLAMTLHVTREISHVSQQLPGGALTSSTVQQMRVFPLLTDDSRILCSMNGIIAEGEKSCSCYDCWQGDECSVGIDIHQCNITADSGTPLLFEDYWLAHPEAEVRMRASFHQGYGGPLPQLEAAIRALHAQVGNAVTDGRQIVIGMGSSMLITAAMYAFSNVSRTPGVPATQVYSAIPYYNGYAWPADYYETRLFEWTAGAAPVATAGDPVIEIITAPNNPDGAMRNKTIAGSFGVHDHAYYWPQFTPIPAPLEYGPSDVAIFTLSKLTGHAGSRIGWAIVGDESIAALMSDHVARASGYVQENQLRATHLLQYVLGDYGSMIDYAKEHMQHRWERLRTVMAVSTRLQLQTLEAAQYDSWTQITRSPAPAYVWLQCTEPRDQDCYQAMLNEGIKGRPGPAFGAGTEYNRLELLMQPAVFDSMAAKLELFVAN